MSMQTLSGWVVTKPPDGGITDPAAYVHISTEKDYSILVEASSNRSTSCPPRPCKILQPRIVEVELSMAISVDSSITVSFFCRRHEKGKNVLKKWKFWEKRDEKKGFRVLRCETPSPLLLSNVTVDTVYW
mmetsp:Transcript_19219/g.47859  ORF Transcript_19219/g.47859 Transcript_19219/m.47859 type:complete len:130 (-) Transcript_19219:974-1363(-)